MRLALYLEFTVAMVYMHFDFMNYVARSLHPIKILAKADYQLYSIATVDELEHSMPNS
jgi:hypothetical protein